MPPANQRPRKVEPVADDDMKVIVTIDGKPYVWRPNEHTGSDARECRRQVGISIGGLIRAMKSDPDIDLIAGVVWLARRQAGERIEYDAVADEITMRTKVSIDQAKAGDEETDGHDPEA